MDKVKKTIKIWLTANLNSQVKSLVCTGSFEATIIIYRIFFQQNLT